VKVRRPGRQVRAAWVLGRTGDEGSGADSLLLRCDAHTADAGVRRAERSGRGTFVDGGLRRSEPARDRRNDSSGRDEGRGSQYAPESAGGAVSTEGPSRNAELPRVRAGGGERRCETEPAAEIGDARGHG